MGKANGNLHLRRKIMLEYIGTKRVKATPMDRGAYNKYRNWPLVAGENPDEQGYLVEYIDGGKPNDKRHEGYISWSPADVFLDNYKSTTRMTFGMALEMLKIGR